MTVCTKCGAKLPSFRKPKSASQVLSGGCTCPKCGAEVDWEGRTDDDRAIGKTTIVFVCAGIGLIVFGFLVGGDLKVFFVAFGLGLLIVPIVNVVRRRLKK